MACSICETPVMGPGVHQVASTHVVIDCPACGDLLLVFSAHLPQPENQLLRSIMRAILGTVAVARMGQNAFFIDEDQSEHPGHFHLHARQKTVDHRISTDILQPMGLHTDDQSTGGAA